MRRNKRTKSPEKAKLNGTGWSFPLPEGED
jgi:hypothetical protein